MRSAPEGRAEELGLVLERCLLEPSIIPESRPFESGGTFEGRLVECDKTLEACPEEPSESLQCRSPEAGPLELDSMEEESIIEDCLFE